MTFHAGKAGECCKPCCMPTPSSVEIRRSVLEEVALRAPPAKRQRVHPVVEVKRSRHVEPQGHPCYGPKIAAEYEVAPGVTLETIRDSELLQTDPFFAEIIALDRLFTEEDCEPEPLVLDGGAFTFSSS